MNKGSLLILFSSILLTTGITLLVILLLPYDEGDLFEIKFVRISLF